MLVDRSELGGLDAVTTAAHIAAGSLSAREVIEAAIARTRLVEPALNAVATEMFEAALDTAEAPPPGPFRGVPTFIKGLEDEDSGAHRMFTRRRHSPASGLLMEARGTAGDGQQRTPHSLPVCPAEPPSESDTIAIHRSSLSSGHRPVQPSERLLDRADDRLLSGDVEWHSH